MIRKIFIAVAAGLFLSTARAENRAYKGNYATGLAKYTVKAGSTNTRVYAGNYATGLAIWTTGTSSDGILRIYAGNYATGLARFCYKGTRLYAGNYATGLAVWTTGTSSDGTFRIYSGNYATGLAKYALKANRLYAGNYATGLAKWTFNAQDEISEGLLVFLATQVLAETDNAIADSSTGEQSSGEQSSGGQSSDFVSTNVVIVTPPTRRETDDTPSVPAFPTSWTRARTLQAVAETDGVPTARVTVKCGKANRRHEASVSVAPLAGRTRRYRSQKITLTQQTTQTVSWVGLSLSIADDSLTGTEALPTPSTIRTARIGGTLPNGTARLTAQCAAIPEPLKGFAVLPAFFPTDRTFTVVGRKWNFPKDDPARVRLSYTPKSGLFKGTFRVLLSNEGQSPSRVRIKNATAKVTGLVVDGEGYGTASVKKPALSFTLSTLFQH